MVFPWTYLCFGFAARFASCELQMRFSCAEQVLLLVLLVTRRISSLFEVCATNFRMVDVSSRTVRSVSL